MLTTHVLQSVSHAGRYFTRDGNYYTKGQDNLSHSAWWGKGAKAMGLEGPVDEQQFKALLAGELPGDITLGTMRQGKWMHRPGFDLTFSAPKAVSIAALVFGDERVIEAHKRAVDLTLKKIESQCAQAYKKKHGVLGFEDTHNLTVATFLHHDSRNNDPNLHTHAVVLNATQRADKRWVSLASSMNRYGEGAKTDEMNGFMERVRHNKHFYGALYRAQLAYEVGQLGYAVIKEKINGGTSFRLKGISDALVKEFSTRRPEIVDNVLKRGEALNAKTAAKANLRTRRPKKTISLEKSQKDWKSRARLVGPKCLKKAQQLMEGTIDCAHAPPPAAITSIIRQTAYALAYHTGVLSETQLLSAACDQLLGQHSTETIADYIDAMKDAGDLVVAHREGTHYQLMPKAMLDCEMRIRQAVAARHRKPVLSSKRCDAFLLQATELNAKEKAVLQTLAASKKRVQLLVSDRRFESTLLPSWSAMVQSAGYHSVVLTPHDIARDAETEDIASRIRHEPTRLLDIIKNWRYCYDRDVRTVAGFVRWQEARIQSGRARYHKMAIFVQRAQDQPPEIIDRLLQVAEKLGARVVLSGDPHAAQKGLFPALIKQSDECVHIDDKLMRADERLCGALSACRVQVASRDTLVDDMAAHYVGLDADTQRQTALWMPSKQLVQQLNQAVHAQRKLHGQLGDTFTQTVLIPSALPPIKRTLAKHYKCHHWIRFNQSYRSMGVKKGDYWRVKDVISEKNNAVLLSNEKGGTAVWYPHRVGAKKEGAIEVFEGKVREFCVGDTVRTVRKSFEQGMRKGDVWGITRICDDSIHLAHAGRTVRLSRQGPLHIDYGYATLAHEAQPQRAHALVYQRATGQGTTQSALRRTLQSVSGDCWIYTEDAAVYKDTLKKQTGLSKSAIDRLLDPQHKIPLAACEKKLKSAIAHSTAWRQYAQAAQPKEALDFAIKHWSEHEAAFSQESILSSAMAAASYHVSPKALEAVLEQLKSEGVLIGQKNVSTPQALSLEKTLLAREEHLPPIASKKTIEAVIKNSVLNPGGKDALRHVLSSHRRINFIEGAPGAGKTTVLKTLQAIVAKEDQSVYCIAPTHRAVQELNDRGLPATTVSHFLGAQDVPCGDILILDEASMVPTKQMVALLKKVTDQNKRLIEVGDTQQLPAIAAGKPFAIQKQQHQAAEMNTIVRQKEAPHLKAAIELTRAGDIAGGFSTLDIQEMKAGIAPNMDTVARKEAEDLALAQRIARTASIFLEDPKNTLCIVPTHADKDQVNTAIRQALIARGALGEDSIQYTALRAKNSTDAEKRRGMHMVPGDIVRIHSAFPQLDIRPGYFCIESITTERKQLVLKNTASLQTHLVHPAELTRQGRVTFDVYTPLRRALRSGDTIIWTRSDRQKAILGSARATVSAIQDNTAQVLLQNGQTVVLDPNDFSWAHFDYGYASTTHALQGGQAPKAVYLIHSYHRTTTRPNWLVGISRAQHVLTVITDDKAKLLHTLEKTPGKKSSALEATGQWPVVQDVATQKRPAVSQNTQEPQQIIDYQAVHQALGQRIITVLQQLMGAPQSKTSTHYIYSYSQHFGGPQGKGQGSLSIAITPEKAGLWQCFKTGDKGNLFALIALKQNTDFKGAVDYACRFLGGELPLKTKNSHYEVLPLPEKKAWTLQEKNRIHLAQKLYKGSQSIAGTLAAQYLATHRGINLSEWPNDVRFHPAIYSKINQSTHPALLVVARDAKGHVQSVQATFLDPDTKNKVKDLPVPKQTFGPLRGAAVDVSLKGVSPSRVLLAEGTETALSLLAASPQSRIKAVLGKSNFKNMDPDGAREILLCLDNDGLPAKGDKIITHTLAQMKQKGNDIACVMPETVGDDFNDVLKKEGIASLQKILKTHQSTAIVRGAIEKNNEIGDEK